LIVIDRPGCGATPPVPLADRIRISGDMVVSVLEHLNIKLDHLIVNSAGI
jgi:pimeloyl-ACP methyl ester carboxylesterase